MNGQPKYFSDSEYEEVTKKRMEALKASEKKIRLKVKKAVYQNIVQAASKNK